MLLLAQKAASFPRHTLLDLTCHSRHTARRPLLSVCGRSLDSPSQSHEALSDISAQHASLVQRSQQHDDPDLDVEAELPSLDSTIPRDVYKKLKPKEKKRQEVLNGKCGGE